MKIPEPLWAVMLALLGVILALACLFHTSVAEQVTLAVLAIASNLVSGALGAFAGHAAANNNVSAPNASTVNAATGAAATFPESK